MADYFTPTVIQRTIPESEMTPLERLLLSHIFEAERDGDGWYFFSEHGRSDIIWVTRMALEDAESFAADETTANRFVKGHLPIQQSEGPLPPTIDLDLTEISWEAILQGRRAAVVDAEICVRGIVLHMLAHACRRIRRRRHGHHGNAILGKSANDLLEEFIEQVAPRSDS
jgi:hypothetical protein